jgi:hypothetical protein
MKTNAVGAFASRQVMATRDATVDARALHRIVRQSLYTNITC